jgi:peptidoglycan hydrolase-like protein with peptidoglycan-binding domain
MYRTLSPGSRGPDVLQLEQTLDRLGFNPGTVNSVYDGNTASAVERLYSAAGYDAPTPDEQLTQAVDAAKKNVDAARSAFRQAQQALKEAKAAPPRPGQDTSVQTGAVNDAQTRLNEALTAQSEAIAKAGTPLPVSEVVYVKTLPRRVDDVKVERGGVVNGTVMSASGASLVVTIQVDAQTKERLKVGLPASLDLGGAPIAATVRRIVRSGDHFNVVVAPKSLTASQLEQLRSANVRVTIPVKSTNGKVLAVPVAALSAGPDGESRVEVQRNGKTDLVKVTVGLSADGYAQVTPAAGAKLAPGDQVVVGR